MECVHRAFRAPNVRKRDRHKRRKETCVSVSGNCGEQHLRFAEESGGPENPAEYKFKELVDVLQRHFEPAPLIIAERFHCHKRDQHEGEGVADYAAVLKQYAERCDFAEFLEQALRDRFMCGLKNSAIQKKLLTEKKLSWQGAVDIAQAMESADKQASNFKNSPVSGTVNAIHGPRPKTGNRNRTYKKNDKFAKPYFCCGGNHLPQTCKFKELIVGFANTKAT